MNRVFITIDLDMADYTATGEWTRFDEVELAFEPLFALLEQYDAPATWFLRMDSQIEALYGDPRYILRQHAKRMHRLVASGHDLQWHHHGYRLENGCWKQDMDDARLCDAISHYGQIAIDEGMTIARMGWGYHSNATMHATAALGFAYDSSAIPRPVYPWALTQCDWSTTPQTPYRPSLADYRVPPQKGDTALPMLEIPMSTAIVPSPRDTMPVRRYIDLSYREQAFDAALQNLPASLDPLLILHPYECIPVTGRHHDLLSFSLDTVAHNLAELQRRHVQFSLLRTCTSSLKE